MLNSEELKEITAKVCEKISAEIIKENRLDNLNEYLTKIDCQEFTGCLHSYQRGAKILVIGDSEITEEDMKNIAIDCCINPKCLEFRLDYKKNKRYDFSILKNNTGYSDVIFGHVAHKGKNIDGYSSAISMMEHEPQNYPNVIRVDNGLKISRNSFRNALYKTQAYKDSIGY